MITSTELSCRNPSCNMRRMHPTAHGTASDGTGSGTLPVHEHPVHGGSRVQLLCSGCGAQVVPCDCCRALLVLWPPAQPKAACQSCGAETTQGDNMRRIVGLPPNSSISAEGAVRLQVQLMGRDAYRGFKVRELQLLREELQREAHGAAAPSAAGSSAQHLRATSAHVAAAEPRTGSGGVPPGEPSDGPAAKRRRVGAADQGFGERTCGGASGEIEGSRNEREPTSSSSSSRRSILTSMARCRWQILLIDEGSGASARREEPGSGATEAQLPLYSMAGGASARGADAASDVICGPDGDEEAQGVTHAHLRVLRELHRSMAACGCLPDETVPDSEDEEADSGSQQASLGCSQAQVGAAGERGPTLRETEDLLDEAGRFLKGRQSLRAKRERALVAQGLVKQAEDDCRQHAELNPGSGGMGASVLLGMLWKRQQECAAEAEAEADATVGPGSWAATRGRSEVKGTVSFICSRLQELEAAEAAAAAPTGPVMPFWGAAAGASPSTWSPGLQQQQRQQLWGDRAAEDQLRAPGPSAAASSSLPSSFQAAVAACLREAEAVLQSCGSGPSIGSPGGPPVVLSSQASGGASLGGGGRGRRGGGQQQGSAEDRASLLTALDLWRRLYRTLATTS